MAYSHSPYRWLLALTVWSWLYINSIAQTYTCSDLVTWLESSGTVGPGLRATCYSLQGRPATVDAAKVQSLTWDTEYTVAAVFVGTSITLDDVNLQQSLLYRPSSSYSLQPAIFSLGPGANMTIKNSVIETTCSQVLQLQADLHGTAGMYQETNLISISNYTRGSLTLTHVNITCTGYNNVSNIKSFVETGDQLQAALSSISQFQLQLLTPGSIMLLNHITLIGTPKTTWPVNGYRMSQEVSLIGTVTSDPFTVLDLAGVPAILRLDAGVLVHFHGLQVQGSCMRLLNLVPAFGLTLYSTNDVWSVFSGSGGPTADRVAKLIEAHDSILLNVPQELYAGMYWLEMTQAPFTQLQKYTAAPLSGGLVLPETIITVVNETTITYLQNEGPSLAQYNTAGSIQLPVTVNQPGFNASLFSLCANPTQTFETSDPRLALNRTVSPIWIAEGGSDLVSAFAAAAARIAATALLAQTVPLSPPLVLVLKELIVPSDVSNTLIFLARDLMLFGPAINPSNNPYGNPTDAALNLQRVMYLIRLSDTSSYGIYITHMTLKGLAAAPLSLVGSSTAQLTPGNNDPTYALPLWFIRASVNRIRVPQIFLSAVTLYLPKEEWKQLYYAAVRGTAYQMGMGANQPLIQGLSQFSVGAGGVSKNGVHLDVLVGWGLNATNILLISEQPILNGELVSEPGYGSLGDGSWPGTSKKGLSSAGTLIGIVIGSIIGFALLLTLVATILFRVFASKRLAYRHDLSKTSTFLDSSQSGQSLKPAKGTKEENEIQPGTPVSSVTGADAMDYKQLHEISLHPAAANIVSQHASREASSSNSHKPGDAPAAAPKRPEPLLIIGKVPVHQPSLSRLGSNMTIYPDAALQETCYSTLSTHMQLAAAAARPQTSPEDNQQPIGGTSPGCGDSSRATQEPQVSKESGHGGSTPTYLGQHCDDLERNLHGARRSSEACKPKEGNGNRSSIPDQSNSRQGGSSDIEDPIDVVIHEAESTSEADETLPCIEKQRQRSSFSPRSKLLAQVTAGIQTGKSAQYQDGYGTSPADSSRQLAATITMKPASTHPVSRSSGSRAASHHQSQTRPASSTDSSGSTRWDPKREVAALAQDMQADVDKLQLLETIGSGGYGSVFRGRWRGLEVAIKTVLFSEGGALAAQQRAITEAAVCTSVAHPNVVATYHYDIMPVGQQAPTQGGLVVEDMTKGQKAVTNDWKLYLVQEFCHASLYSVLSNKLMHVQDQPDLDLLLTTLLNIAQGMLYLHGKNILHGDLKPENVLLKNDTTADIGVVAKITDFGLSNRLDPSATHISNVTNGTPFYAAPEIVRKGQISKASDVYSFGVLMWEMYLATPPWVKTKEGYKGNGRFPKFPATAPAVYVNLTKKCLETQPKARPDFATIVAQLISMHEAFLKGFNSLVHPPMHIMPPVGSQTSGAALPAAMPQPWPAGIVNPILNPHPGLLQAAIQPASVHPAGVIAPTEHMSAQAANTTAPAPTAAAAVQLQAALPVAVQGDGSVVNAQLTLTQQQLAMILMQQQQAAFASVPAEASIGHMPQQAALPHNPQRQ